MSSNATVQVKWTQSYKAVPNKVGFLDLPRELRDLCYAFAMRVPGAIFIYSSDPYSYHSWRPNLKGRIVKEKNEGPLEPKHIQDIISTSILRTCRQIHTEAVEVVYGRNVFRFYMSNADFAPSYRSFIRHITFTMEAGRGIYNDDMEVMGYWWRRVFWPNIIEKSSTLIARYPNVEALTFPIKSNQLGQTWRPAFFAVEQKTREQRIYIAARWMRGNCPLRDERLRQVLHVEVMPSSPYEFAGSRFCPDDDDDDWNCEEFSEAFEQMKMM